MKKTVALDIDGTMELLGNDIWKFYNNFIK
jgi:hypothetical protein